MNSTKLTFIIIFLGLSLITSNKAIGQDTIKLEPSIIYPKEECTFTKTFAGKIERAEEFIIQKDNKIKVEYCFYFDNERHGFGETYEILEDSILKITYDYNEVITWKFKRIKKANLPQNDAYKYEVWKDDDGIQERGQVKRLIPFQKVSVFTISNNNEVLWTEDYTRLSHYNRSIKPIFSYPQEQIKRKIYIKEDEVDQLPSLLSGDHLPIQIEIKREDACLSEPLMRIEAISFIVTKNGEILNIKQEKGSYRMDWCPYFIHKIMKYISRFGKLTPAKKNGKSVNYKCIIKVIQK